MIGYKRLAPLLNRVLIKRAEPITKTASGIILNEEKEMSYGEVVATGPGIVEDNGFRETNVKVGDTVLLPSWDGQRVDLAGDEYSLYRDTDLVGILEEKVV